MFGFDSKDVFFGFPYVFWNGKKKKTLLFWFFWTDVINQDIKKRKIKLKDYLVFQHFRCCFLHWKVSRTKKTKVFVFFDILIDYIRSKKTKNLICLLFSFQKKNWGNPKKTSFESKPNILWKVVFFVFLVLLEFFFFWICLLIHMIAICVLMRAYLVGPGKSNFDQSFSFKSLRTMWD